MPGDDDGTWAPQEAPNGTWMPSEPSLADGSVGEAAGATAPSRDAGARYQLGPEVARGGLGRIVEAWDHQLDREVAVKQLLRPSPGAEARFDREMHLTARLQHPNIVPVFDGGRLEGTPYLAMRRVHGRSLADALAVAEGLDARMGLLSHLIDVANAVAYAHGQRVVHRDLKPDNVLVGDFGETVVIDWGLAKDLDADITEEVAPPGRSLDEAGSVETPLASGGRPSSRSLTRVGSVMGTPRYMAPEQAGGGSVDARSDVYALGAMLYELLAGQPPYDGEDDVLASVRAGPPVDVTVLEPTAPRDLTSVVRRAMAREPADRYDDAASFAKDLSRFLEGRFVSAYDYTTMERLTRLVKQHPLASGLVVLMFVGTVAFVAALDRSRSVAEAERAEAARLEEAAVLREDELRIDQARRLVELDPAKAVELLAGLSERTPFDGRVRTLFSAAMAARPGLQLATLPEIRRPMAVADGALVLAAVGGGIDVRDLASGDRATFLEEQVVHEVVGLGHCVAVRTDEGLVRVVDGRLEQVWDGPETGIGWFTEGLAVYPVPGAVVRVGCEGPARSIEHPEPKPFAFADGDRTFALSADYRRLAVAQGDGPFRMADNPCRDHRWGYAVSGHQVLAVGEHATVCAFGTLFPHEPTRWEVPGASWLEHLEADGDGGVFVAGGGHQVWHLDAHGAAVGQLDVGVPVYALGAFPGGVWVGTADGILRWTDADVQRIPTPHAVRWVRDIDGVRAVAALGDQVRVLSTVPTYREILPPGTDSDTVALELESDRPLVLRMGSRGGSLGVTECGEGVVSVERDRTVRWGGQPWLPAGTGPPVVTCMEKEDRLVVGRPGEGIAVYRLQGPSVPERVAIQPVGDGQMLLASAPGGAFALGGGQIVHWDGEAFSTADAPPGKAVAILAAPDAEGVLAMQEELFALHGARLEPLPPPRGRISAVAYGDGYLAVGTQSGTIDLRGPDGEAVTLLRHGRWIEQFDFSPDGRFLASGGWDEVAVLWDLSVWPPEGRTLRGHGDGVYRVGFVAGGLVSMGYDGQVLTWADPWPLDPDELRGVVGRAARDLAAGRAPPPPPAAPPILPVVDGTALGEAGAIP